MYARRVFIILPVIMILVSSLACDLPGQAATPQVEPSPAEALAASTGEVDISGPDPTALDPFLIPLLDALTQTPPDYGALQASMSSEFWVYEPFVAQSYSPADAIAQLGANYLPSYAAVTYNLDVDPHSMATFPLPEADEFVYTTGWGVDGSFMGILVIVQTADGYEWSGVFTAQEPAAAAAGAMPEGTSPTRIQFAAGATSATVEGSVAANGIEEYVLYALEGQTMTVTITSPSNQVYLSIAGLGDGLPLVRAASDATSWTGILPASQDYSIKAVSGGVASNYTMEVIILSPGESGVGGPVPDPAWGFKQALILALSPPRDYEALTNYMGDSFEIMIWYGNGEQMPPSEAANALRNAFLPPRNTLTFEEPDYTTLLGDSPYRLYPNAVDFLFARGWGATGNDEALLHLAQRPDGSLYWSGILYANDGFASSPPPVLSWIPLPSGVCQDLQVSVADTLGVTDTTLDENAPFDDYIGGTSGTGCLITVNGTGADFESHSDVFSQLREMLVTQGWTPDPQYDGGGPTGTLGGFRRDSGLVLLSVGWDPSEDADCPPDQPIGACPLPPEQQIYTITLSAAMQ